MRDLVPNEAALFVSCPEANGYAILDNSSYKIICKLYSNTDNRISETFEKLVLVGNESLFTITNVLNGQLPKIESCTLNVFISNANLRLLGIVLTRGQKFYYGSQLVTVIECIPEVGEVDYHTNVQNADTINNSIQNYEFLNVKVPDYPFNLVSENDVETRLFLTTRIKMYVFINDLSELKLDYVNVVRITKNMPLLKECIRREVKLIGISDQKCIEFSNVLDLGLPTFSDRAAILSKYQTKWQVDIIQQSNDWKDLKVRSSCTSTRILNNVLVETRGFSIGDVRLLLQNTLLTNKTLTPRNILDQAMISKPANLVDITTKLPNIFFKDLYGIDSIVKFVKSTIVDPFKNPQKYSEFVNPPKGILLYGHSGSGKTMLATAIANETGLPCIYVSAATLRSKIVGESEERIHKLFSRARASAPTMILLENFEMICPVRGHLSQGDSRMVTTFLQEMDGIKQTKGVFVLGVTEDYNLIDPAVRRPGRIDMKLELPKLDIQNRLAILKGKLELIEHDLDNDFVEKLALPDRNAAQVCALLNEALMNAIRRNAETLAMNDFPKIK